LDNHKAPDIRRFGRLQAAFCAFEKSEL